MITRKEQPDFSPFYESSLLPPIHEVLFFDIETTGLSAKTASLYLIGALVFRQGSWQLFQWMAESPEEEGALIETFLEFLSPCSWIAHFNGTSFDVPFLRRKIHAYHLQDPFCEKQSFDLFRSIRPLGKIFCLEHLNQTSLEQFLDISREDKLDGRRLIPIYQNYVQNHDPKAERLLLLHNRDDLTGMLRLLPLLSYPDFFSGKFQVLECSLDAEDRESFSLIFSLSLYLPVPKPLSCRLKHGYLRFQDTTAQLLIKGKKGLMKHFFSNYQEYYYLPLEDTAIHKSIGAYVDREHREQARASTCYMKKAGAFLPCSLPPEGMNLFRSSYRDSQAYIQCTPEFLSSSSLQTIYCQSVVALPSHFSG